MTAPSASRPIAKPPDEDTVARVEGHRYEPVRLLQYRNSALDFFSPARLAGKPRSAAARTRPRQSAARHGLRQPSRVERAGRYSRYRRARLRQCKKLWEVCQIPDFRKLSLDDHVRLVGQIYRHLMSDEGVLPEDWFARQIARLDATEGDVATLSSGRLTQIRTWTYAAQRPGWLADQTHWQEQTRAIEDRLSDALHERLTQRFVDRRTSVLMRRLREDEVSQFALDDSGAVSISGEFVGKLDGISFRGRPRSRRHSWPHAARRRHEGLEGEFLARARRLADADAKAIHLSEHGQLWWDGAVVGKLVPGPHALEPGVMLLADEHLRSDTRERLQARLDTWVAELIADRLEPLVALRRAAEAKPGHAKALPAFARGLAYQLCEVSRSLDRTHRHSPAGRACGAARAQMFGVRFGRRAIFCRDF